MFVILEATAGPVTGRRIQVLEGSILRVGRTARSDYALGEDSYLSGQHFAIEYDGMQCQIRDLASSNGTFVNGERITDRILQEGDSIGAGGSTFIVHIDSSSPTPEPPRSMVTPTLKMPGPVGTEAAAAAPVRAKSNWAGFSHAQSILLDVLYREGESVYAVLDSVRDSRIPAFLDAAGEKYARMDEENGASPYLVLLPSESRLLDVLIKDGWHQGWGFYAPASVDFETALRHWRPFVTLRNRDGHAVTYRFWEPRVLRAITPVMASWEAAAFFGPISRLVVEGDKPEVAVEFSLAPSGVSQRALALG
jgi:hypothetical protein